ncbi:MAG: 23S rRNA (uracil(1939)-C(5))-methyltransferase RlmD [Lachnospiraceae bacterium]|nr:23S rRNA (uracil(1939)-C(5))-methyltransferase RlmD [Lachnospiraceae bacterium]
MEAIKKNDRIKIRITDLGNDGEGIGHLEEASGLTVFVKHAIPGDLVLALVLKVKKSYAFAKVLEVIEASPFRCEPECPIAGKCGGCQLQNMSYEGQLKYKAGKVKNDLMRIGGVVFADGEDGSAGPVFEPIVGMEEPLRYRNKGQFPVGFDGKEIVAGFYRERTHDIADTEECLLQHPVTSYVIRAVKAYMASAKIEPYDEATRRGTVRHILVRVGYATGEVMVCLVVNAKRLRETEQLENMLKTAIEDYERERAGSGAEGVDLFPKHPYCRLASLSYNINTENTNVILGEKVVNLLGPGYIRDVIGITGGGAKAEGESFGNAPAEGITYRISPLSFYQVNPVQTAKLYATVLEYAVMTGEETVWDLYCGIGTISLFLAKRAKRVYGVEIVPQAVEDARKNARENGIDNAEFFVGAAEEVLPAKYREDPSMRADVVVVDPPRKGCAPALLDCVAALEPQKIVYVSCDPATLSRDVKRIASHGYEVKRVRPVDMFPQTVHVETVVQLSKGDINKGSLERKSVEKAGDTGIISGYSKGNKAPETTNVKIDFSLENLDLSELKGKATYEQIKDYVREQTGFRVSSLYISQVKRKCGLEVGESYNKPKSEDVRQPQCTPEKEEAIMQALRYYGMI